MSEIPKASSRPDRNIKPPRLPRHIDSGSLLCLIFGHKWEYSIDGREGFLIRDCKRCECRQAQKEKVVELFNAWVDFPFGD
jgi:hypothetical protein